MLGLTVANSLRLLGHEVQIISEQEMSDAAAQRDPKFASAFPAASIIPHTVDTEDLKQLVSGSDKIFEVLADMQSTGVRLQRHFELSENASPVPEYARLLRGFQIHESGSDTVPIRRSGATSVHGVSFNCFFCNMPRYGPWLDKLRGGLEVAVERRHLTVSTLRRIKAEVIVNCLGAGASSVFAELSPGISVRGILLLCDYDAPNAPPQSYNYTPDYSVYPGSDGEPADVYFYPREGQCILGGTRQRGTVAHDTGQFIPDQPLQGELTSVFGVSVPKPIIDLNRELVRQLTGVELGPPTKVLIGLRHMDVDPQTGKGKVTIAPRQVPDGPPVIDCFGFGGAGVTLSWGAAARVVAAVEELMTGRADRTPAECTDEISDRLTTYLRKEKK
ncbi:MAG TPA: FAD-dependent oxidoreductase [Caulobacterales bacterium]|nr:FAD-dependent oxidoreductase [Caulobacterales bacterium]